MPKRTPRFAFNSSPRPRAVTHKLKYDGEWKRLRDARLAANPLCQHCEARGRVEPATEVDHIKPLALGGQHEWENTASICRPCHTDKTAQDIATIARSI